MKFKSNRWAGLERIAAHEVCRPRFSLRNPYVANLGDFEVYPLWDYYGVAVATAVGAQDLFTVPRGQNHTQGGLNIIKTAWHTSMTKAGELPNPNRILVRRVCAYLINRMNQVDVTRFLDETVLSLVIGAKTFLQCLLAKFPAGGGVWLQSVVNGAGIAGSGIPQSGEGYKLVAPSGSGLSGAYPAVDGVDIAQGQSFRVNLDPTLATAFNAVGVGFTTAAAGATPAGIGVHALIFLEGTQLLTVQ